MQPNDSTLDLNADDEQAIRPLTDKSNTAVFQTDKDDEVRSVGGDDVDLPAPKERAHAYGGNTVVTTMPNRRSEDDSNSNTSTLRSIVMSKGRLSSTKSDGCSRETFEETIGMSAGRGTAAYESPMRLRTLVLTAIRRSRQTSTRADTRADTRAEYDTKFETTFDAAFAHWLQSEDVASNAINRLLQDPNVEPLSRLLSWKSAKAMRAKMQGHPRELAAVAGDWYTKDVTVPTMRTASGYARYTLRYRKVEDTIRFLLGHKGFVDDLIYQPYCTWSTDEPKRRIYSDMASADWWWDTQVNVNIDSATIVLLIVSSDKTQLTNH